MTPTISHTGLNQNLHTIVVAKHSNFTLRLRHFLLSKNGGYLERVDKLEMENNGEQSFCHVEKLKPRQEQKGYSLIGGGWGYTV